MEVLNEQRLQLLVVNLAGTPAVAQTIHHIIEVPPPIAVQEDGAIGARV